MARKKPQSMDDLKYYIVINQSAEELEKYSVDDSLSDLDRILYILAQGTTAQKTAVLNNLQLYIDNDPNLLPSLLPKLYVDLFLIHNRVKFPNRHHPKLK